MVKHLICRTCRPVRNCQQLIHVVRVEVGNTPAADLARLLQGPESLDRIRQRMAAAPVQKVQVDPVGFQPLQAALASGDGAGSGCVLRQHLADDEHLVANPGCRLGNHLLGTARGIHLGRVDQCHTQVDTQSQRIGLLRRFTAPLAHVPGALAQSRYGFTARESNRSHHAAKASAARMARRKLPPHSFSRAPRS